jgi:hypothetical protein
LSPKLHDFVAFPERGAVIVGKGTVVVGKEVVIPET